MLGLETQPIDEGATELAKGSGIAIQHSMLFRFIGESFGKDAPQSGMLQGLKDIRIHVACLFGGKGLNILKEGGGGSNSCNDTRVRRVWEEKTQRHL